MTNHRCMSIRIRQILLLLASSSRRITWSWIPRGVVRHIHLHPISYSTTALPIHHRYRCTRLYRARSLSASEIARRDENRRRKERSQEVVIGKTSALPNATDYALSPSSTEEEYLRQASAIDQAVYRYTERGLEALKNLRINDAIESFDVVFELRPNAYVWQAGIAKFYAGDLTGAANIFAKSAVTYESKFGIPATEERIWWYACHLKLKHSMSRNNHEHLEETNGVTTESHLTPIPMKENTVNLLRQEHRKVIRIALELFSSSAEQDFSRFILSRAKLLAIGDIPPSIKHIPPPPDRKMWKINSWYYMGLHYDTTGDTEESKRCMKTALRLFPNSGSSSEDIVHSLPFMHMSMRDWFDDEVFDPQIMNNHKEIRITAGAKVGSAEMTPAFLESVKLSIETLRKDETKQALQHRGMKSSGSSDHCKQLLYDSIVEEPGIELLYNAL